MDALGYGDKHTVAPNAILPIPNSDERTKEKKDKSKYGGPASESLLRRATRTLVGESTKEGSVLGDERASVDDLLSDLGSIDQLEGEGTASSASSASRHISSAAAVDL